MTTPRKLSAAMIGAPVAIVTTWGFTTYTGIPVPAEVGAALGGIFTFVASVLIPDEKEE